MLRLNSILKMSHQGQIRVDAQKVFFKIAAAVYVEFF